MNKKEAQAYYKEGLSYERIVQDFHRSRYIATAKLSGVGKDSVDVIVHGM
jgi:hypothetical protein